jgi:hypothetical protein
VYKMLSRILRVRDAISTVLSKREYQKYRSMNLNDAEIRKIESLVKILEPFYFITEKVSGGKYATSSMIFPSCFYLYKRVSDSFLDSKL